MRTHVALRALGLLVISAATSFALPITYNFVWSGQSPLPTSGSFTYDSSLTQFTNFTIVWDGYTFNFLPVVNSTVSSSGCGNITTQQIFNFLTAANTSECNPGPDKLTWQGLISGQYAIFNLFNTDGGQGVTDIELSVSDQLAITGSFGPISGLYSVTPASVPEPSTLFLALAGGGLLLGKRMGARRKSADPVVRA